MSYSIPYDSLEGNGDVEPPSLLSSRRCRVSLLWHKDYWPAPRGLLDDVSLEREAVSRRLARIKEARPAGNTTTPKTPTAKIGFSKRSLDGATYWRPRLRAACFERWPR